MRSRGGTGRQEQGQGNQHVYHDYYIVTISRAILGLSVEKLLFWGNAYEDFY